MYASFSIFSDFRLKNRRLDVKIEQKHGNTFIWSQTPVLIHRLPFPGPWTQFDRRLKKSRFFVILHRFTHHSKKLQKSGKNEFLQNGSADRPQTNRKLFLCYSSVLAIFLGPLNKLLLWLLTRIFCSYPGFTFSASLKVAEPLHFLAKNFLLWQFWDFLFCAFKRPNYALQNEYRVEGVAATHLGSTNIFRIFRSERKNAIFSQRTQKSKIHLRFFSDLLFLKGKCSFTNVWAAWTQTLRTRFFSGVVGLSLNENEGFG